MARYRQIWECLTRVNVSAAWYHLLLSSTITMSLPICQRELARSFVLVPLERRFRRVGSRKEHAVLRQNVRPPFSIPRVVASVTRRVTALQALAYMSCLVDDSPRVADPLIQTPPGVPRKKHALSHDFWCSPVCCVPPAVVLGEGCRAYPRSICGSHTRKTEALTLLRSTGDEAMSRVHLTPHWLAPAGMS